MTDLTLPMEILNSLREATRQLHTDIEKDNTANKIMDHSISLEDYKLLLFQNFLAYKAAESEIEKFLPNYGTDKTQRLQKDLENLGIRNFNGELEFTCNSEAEAIGAAYVIEGSAMGGMLIGKELKNCEALKSMESQHYFNGERSSMQGWNKFLKYLRSQEFEPAQITAAENKAKETFLLFKKAFQFQLSDC